MSINNKAAKECLVIITKHLNNDTQKVNELLRELNRVKTNASFHNSINLLLDFAKQQRTLTLFMEKLPDE